MAKPLYIRALIQQSLALGHLADDDGRFAWVMCRKGLQAACGQKFKGGDKPLLRVTVEVVSDDDELDAFVRQAAGEPQQGTDHGVASDITHEGTG